MRVYWRVVALALPLGLGACATITRGTTTQFTVESAPPGAQAKTSTGFSCEATPCTFKMPRKEKFAVTVSKTGYKTATMDIDSKMAAGGGAGFLGNAIVGGVIGAGVDIASGAMNELSPNPARFTLIADTPPAPPAPSDGAIPPATTTQTPSASPAPQSTPSSKP